MARTRTRSTRVRRGAAAGVSALLLASALPLAAAAKDTVAFTIGDDRVTESSGLAADEVNGLYWTANDSGDGGVVYGVEPDGGLRGTLNFRADPVDVEAVAVDGNRLYVADIGDNEAERDLVSVYFLTNPRANGLTVTYNSYDFRYPDGAHDAETLLVDGDGRLMIVTKGVTAGVYVAPKAPSRSGTNVLRRVADAPPLVTDGVVLPGGDQIALLTYGSVEVLDAASFATVSSVPIPDQPQAESLAVDLDGSRLLVGSEGRRSKVYALPLPGAEETPTPSPTPTAEPTPSDAGDNPAEPVPEEEATPGAGRSGTVWAVGLAAVVAVVAGVVVGLVRRP